MNFMLEAFDSGARTILREIREKMEYSEAEIRLGLFQLTFGPFH